MYFGIFDEGGSWILIVFWARILVSRGELNLRDHGVVLVPVQVHPNQMTKYRNRYERRHDRCIESIALHGLSPIQKQADSKANHREKNGAQHGRKYLGMKFREVGI